MPLLALGVLVGGGSWVALVLWRRGWRLPEVVVRRLPDVAAGLVVLAGAYLASRPLWQVARQDPNDPGARYVAGMQARQGLPVDGGRTYAEQTVVWLSWYVGPVALVVALAVLAVLVRRALVSVGERRVEAWVPALVVAAGSTLLTLLRPGITPDHPWADRRLLVALPLVVALLVVGVDWLVRRSAASGRTWLGATAAGVVAALVVVPALVATWPHRGWRGGARVAGRGRVGVRRAGPGDVVLAVDSRAANEWPQVGPWHVRGPCAVAHLARALRRPAAGATVDRVAAGVEERGGRLVLLAADSGEALDRARRHALVGRRGDGPRGRARPRAGPGAHRPAADRRLARAGAVGSGSSARPGMPTARRAAPSASLKRWRVGDPAEATSAEATGPEVGERAGDSAG